MPNERILIVEDEAIVAADLEDRLQGLGYTVVGKAVTAADALRKAGETKADLVLMDIVLQGGADGTQAAEDIAKLYALPVVYVTAHTDEATVKRAQATRPYGYVLKPFDERELSIAIEIALYRNRVEAQLRSLNQQLQSALDQVKALQELLPICTQCKKVRKVSGHWERVENYLAAHSDVEFTHGICPECLEKGVLARKGLHRETSSPD